MALALVVIPSLASAPPRAGDSGLRRVRVRACAGVLLLETIVLDAEEPLLALADEPKTVNQALGGIAIRPSRAFVAMALNRVGFRHVYGLSRPPSHEDFQVDWLNDRRSERDGHPIRSIFVASHHALMQPALRPLLS